MPIIELPYAGNSFDSEDLISYIWTTGRDYIIQGQIACNRAAHSKPNSLDCWLRDNYARNPDTKQAVNDVIEALIHTGSFEKGIYICPDSGKRCKGIKVL